MERFTSRKFLLSLFAIVVVAAFELAGLDVDPTALIAIVATAVGYDVSQAIVDARKVQAALRGGPDGIASDDEGSDDE